MDISATDTGALGGTDEELAARRLRLTLDLAEAAFVMMRQNLRRRLPDASDREIDAHMRVWLARPDGLPRSHFRPRDNWPP